MLTDCHVHLAALPCGANGAYVAPDLLAGPLFRWLARSFELDLSAPAAANERYLERLAARLEAARRVDRAVLLALDGPMDRSGRPDWARAAMVVPNALVFAACRSYPQFLPGASVNPARAGAMRELRRVAGEGAVLLKLLPNTQRFDPADGALRPFWALAARLHLPILAHVGHEFAVGVGQQALGEPRRWENALAEGATVIAAHAGSSGRFFRQPHWRSLVALAAKFPNLYLDSSALTLPNRMGILRRLSRSSLRSRLLFGTDQPLPVTALPLAASGRFLSAMQALRISNAFDRHAFVLERMGLAPDETLAARVLRLPSRR